MTVRQAVRLGHILTRSDSWIVLEPGEEYKEVTIRLWGRGVVRRRVTNNSVVAGARRLRVRAGQFILSRIDARNGAFGLVPRELDGAVVSNDFPAFGVDQDRVEPAYLGWLSKTRDFMQRCRAASEGTTNRVRLNEARFLELEISIPPLPEQRRIVARLDELARKTEEIRSIRASLQSERRQLLLSVFHRLTMKAPSQRLGEVAPVTRRPVRVREDAEYPELGIRSFGKGTFHKPALPGIGVGSKKLFEIRPGDLVLSNVFAWEGAVAVAGETDAGRYGSHRFITCVPNDGVTTSQFLCFNFLTPDGLEQLRKASPGGAGRNRTLGLNALSEIEVPIPAFGRQLWFVDLVNRFESLKRVEDDSARELDALLPSTIEKAFNGRA